MVKIPIVDAHLHIWDVNKFRYPWLDNQSYLNRTFTIDDYQEASKKMNVEKMVFVQCECEPAQYKDEVKWVTEVAQKDKRIEGIVAWAPLEKGEAVRPELEELSKNRLVKGIRRIIEYEEDMEFCLKPDFVRGVQMLKDYDMTFDICISYRHNKNTIKFIEKVGPEVKMILDHIGKPNIKDQILDPWREEIKVMSKFSNVFCKVSSLPSEADWDNWTRDDIRPFGEHVFECFGFDKTVYASDWPPCERAADFYTCANLVDELIEGATEEQRRKVFHDNAIRFYNL